jgi:hypothetical protein
MTDLETMLSNARHGMAPPTAATVDADVNRGHRALVHRKLRRTGVRSLAVGALAVGSFAVVQSQGGHSTSTAVAPPAKVHPAVATPAKARQTTAQVPQTTAAGITAGTTTTSTKVSHGAHLAIKLVDYTGAQPAGYTVGSVPSGWDLQGVNNFALVIGPKWFPDQSLNDFQGKLVVMLASKDEPAHQTGAPVAVGDLTGVVRHDDPSTTQLFFTDSAGHHIDIQAPSSLHWSDAQLGAFAATVQVSKSAQAGEG